MLGVIAYIGSIVFINAAFAWLGANVLTNAVAGLVFIFRDVAQRAVGHWVLLAMLAAAVLSYFVSSAAIALASAVAFALSEFIDYLVYTFTRRPWADRMLISSLASTPIDSAVFLWLAGFWSWSAVLVMTAAKIAVALAVFAVVRYRARTVAA